MIYCQSFWKKKPEKMFFSFVSEFTDNNRKK